MENYKEQQSKNKQIKRDELIRDDYYRTPCDYYGTPWGYIERQFIRLPNSFHIINRPTLDNTKVDWTERNRSQQQ